MSLTECESLHFCFNIYGWSIYRRSFVFFPLAHFQWRLASPTQAFRSINFCPTPHFMPAYFKPPLCRMCATIYLLPASLKASIDCLMKTTPFWTTRNTRGQWRRTPGKGQILLIAHIHCVDAWRPSISRFLKHIFTQTAETKNNRMLNTSPTHLVLASDAWYGVAHGCTRKLGMKICGKCHGHVLFI